MKHYLGRLEVRAILLLLPLCMVACNGKEENQERVELTKVKVEQVVESEEKPTLQYIGVIEERSSAALSFMTSGTIMKIDVREGQLVRKGQLLASLTAPSTLQAEVAAKVKYEQAKDAYDRMKKVYDSGSLADVKFVEVQTALTQAEAMYEVAKNEVEDTYLYAPFSGVVGEKLASVGEAVLPATPVLTLLQADDVMVKIKVPEQEILKIHQGANASLNVNILPGKTYRGKVAWTGVVADALSHNYEVMIAIENAPVKLLPSMLCEASIEIAETGDGVEIPNRAVSLNEKNRTFVWLVEDGKAIRKEVKIGDLTSKGVKVVEGLEIGDEYVIEGSHKLSEGLEVEIQ